MSENRWIITYHRFHEHKTVEQAEAELERLRKLFPERKFRMYRIKRPAPEPAPENGERVVIVGDHPPEIFRAQDQGDRECGTSSGSASASPTC